MRLSLVAVVAAVLSVAQTARGDDFVWIGATSTFETWSDPTNWRNVTPGGTTTFPDISDTALFNTNAITSGGDVLNLSIAPTATLSITNGVIIVEGGTINNQHSVALTGSETAGAAALFAIGAVTLNGGGEVHLVDQYSELVSDSTETLTNVDNLIHGGNGAYISAPMTNHGTIRADSGALNIVVAPINNDGGILQVLTGASLQLIQSIITGGTLTAQPGSLVSSFSEGALNGVTNPGTITVLASLTLQNNFINTGTIDCAGSDVVGSSLLTIDGQVAFSGGGEVRLPNSFSSIFPGANGGTLTSIDNFIHGGNGATIAVPIINQGVLQSDSDVFNIQTLADNSIGTLRTQIAGLSAGGSTFFHITSDTTLGGTLEITFLNGFVPHTGDVLRPLQIDGTVTGDFSQIIFHGLAPGFEFQGQFVGGFYQVIALNDAQAAPLIISPLAVTTIVDQPFFYQIVSSPNATSYDASPLPAGLTIDPATGIISGVPTQTGTSQVSLSATANGTGTATLVLTIAPRPTVGPVLTSGMASTGRTGQPFTFQVTTTGGSPAASLAVGGLPPGLTADPASGLISGTPTTDGSFGVTLTVTDGPIITTGTIQLTFTSDPEFPVIISSQSAALTPGESFLYTIVAPGSSDPGDPTTFGLVGTLPPGLSFDAQAGTISGIFVNPLRHNGTSPNIINLSGGIVTNVQLFAVNSHGTSVLPLIFFLAPTGTVNISTRLAVGTNDDVLTAGFFITGNAPKKVIIRALGPSLAVTGAIQDPTLELHDGTSLLASNDDWRQSQESQIVATTIAPANDHEAAIVAYLDPGGYTAIVRGKDNSTGVAIVEVYDLGTAGLTQSSQAQLAQISTRGTVLTGENVMIGGFIIHGTQTRVIMRAIGPSLSGVISGALQDTVLELYDGSGSLIASNDDWRSTQEQEIIKTGVPPSDNRESAIVANLNPGPYTGIVRGHDNTTGVALVEVYALQ